MMQAQATIRSTKRGQTVRKQTKPLQALDTLHQQRLQPLLDEAPWVLRITEWKTKPPPLFILQQRRSLDGDKTQAGMETELVDRGLLYGPSQQRCLLTIQAILTRVQDEDHRLLELQRFVTKDGLTFRGNIPLDEEAGCKLGLIFKLQERVKELDRVELIARRIDRFTKEETAYWLSRISNFGDDANRWAISGMKIMLGGHPQDKAVDRMLEQLRTRY